MNTKTVNLSKVSLGRRTSGPLLTGQKGRTEMTRRIKAYIRRTVLACATEGAYPAKRRTKESTLCAFRDSMHGTDTGWWNDLIYTKDVLDMFNRYRSDVAQAIVEYLSETGAEASQPVLRDDTTTYADMLAACSRRWTWDDYTAADYSYRNNGAMAAALAIRFAVEYLTGEVASELGVEV